MNSDSKIRCLKGLFGLNTSYAGISYVGISYTGMSYPDIISY